MSRPFLPYGRQTIDDRDIDAVVSALRSPLITQGPLVDRFESSLADYLGAEHVTVCSSGTAALHLAYAALGLGPGDEIITSPITFAATANAARYLGSEVRFADVDPGTGNLLPSSVASLVGPKTRGIVAVHLGGLPADLQALRAIADRHGLWLAEDAAHALGATYRGERIGSGFCDVSTFSFHPVKHITTGEGGAVATSSPELTDTMRRLRHHGIEKSGDRWTAKANGPLGAKERGRWYYEQQELGFNYRLTDMQCALGLSQLRHQAEWVAKRRSIAAHYRKRIGSALGGRVQVQKQFDDRQSAYHLFPVLIDFAEQGTTRDRVMHALEQSGVGSQVHYIPVSWQPYYQNRYGHPQSQTGVSRYYQRTLSLPMFPTLEESDVDHIVDALHAALCSKNKL